MSDITGERKLIQSEEVAYAAAVSSGTGSRIGSVLNFHTMSQHQKMSWKFNGKYGRSTSAQTGVDGSVFIMRDCIIIGFAMSNLVNGTSGSTEIDIIRFQSSGSGTTIFGTRPQISTAGGNNVFMSAWYDPNEVLENPSGTLLPSYTSMLLNKGDMLTFNFVQRMAGAQDLTVELTTRLR